jgi:hypothetical protein
MTTELYDPALFEKQRADFHWYLDNQDELVACYNGKVIAIKDRTVLGAYNSIPEAVDQTMEHHELGTFIVQRVSPGPEAYTQTVHSRFLPWKP